MIYFIAKKISVPGFEGILPIVVGFTEGSDSVFGISELLSDSAVLESTKNTDYEISVAWLPGDRLPIVSFVPEDVSDEQVVNLSSLVDFIEQVKQKYGELNDTLIGRILQQVSNTCELPEAKRRLLISMMYLEYRDSSIEESLGFPIKVGDCLHPNFMIETQKKIEEHNNQFSSVFKSISPDSNVTVFQSVCTDKFFLEIPDRSTLSMLDVEEYASVIPKRTSVCNPYTDKNAYSPDYKELGVGAFLIPLIEGDPANNFLGIQDNEIDYYNALNEWAQYNMAEEFKENNTGEVLDRLSQSYFTELADIIYSWHWAHNRNIPVSFSEGVSNDESDDFDDSTSDASADSRYAYHFREGEDFHLNNAIMTLNEFLAEASLTLGYKVYLEAIIKLGRWGTRKCTALGFDGFELVLDLGTNTVKRNLGSIDSYDVVEINGKNQILGSLISLGSKVADSSFGVEKISIPVGMYLITTLKGKDGNTLPIGQYVSFIDAIKMIESGKLTIDGFDLVNGSTEISIELTDEVTIKELLDEYRQNLDGFLQDPFYRSQELKDLSIRFGSGSNSQNLSMMAILDEAIRDPQLQQNFKVYSLHDESELRDKMLKGIIYSPASALITNVTSTIMPMLLELNRKYLESDRSLKSIWSLWKSALCEYAGINSFWVKEESSKAVKETKSMNAFATQSENSVKSESEENEMEGAPILIRDVAENAVFSKITDFEGRCIGGYTKDESSVNGQMVKKYTFVDNDFLSTVSENRVTNGSVCVLKVLPFLIGDLHAIGTCHNDNIRAYFNSVEAIAKYRNAIKETVDQVMKVKKELGN